MYRRFIKRGIDLVAAILLLIVFAIPLLIVCVLVRVIMGPPVVFTQRRAGLGGREFRIYKFRSMKNTRGADGELLPDADRTPKFGKLIRSTSVDELPGLWNVLKGEMSLIGPRPLLLEYLPYYTEEEMTRHSVRPGMVGLAAVRGRNDQTWEATFAHDVEYVKNCSLGLDLRIFFDTIGVVLKREGVDSVATVRPVLSAVRQPRQPNPAEAERNA